MASLKDRIFLICGQDYPQRRLIIENIKKRILQKATGQFNTLTFYAKEIDIKDLQEKILLIPFDQKKILIFKDAENIPKAIKEFLLNDITKILSNNYILFETEKTYFTNDRRIAQDKFLNFVFSNSTLFKVGKYVSGPSFSDFIISIRSGDLSTALYVLAKLFEVKASDSERKVLGLQLFGVLVSEVSYLKDNDLRRKYLKHLLKTDRLIKEKGMEPRLAIELFLSKSFVP
jgi:DNA polymerase III delta subunit